MPIIFYDETDPLCYLYQEHEATTTYLYNLVSNITDMSCMIQLTERLEDVLTMTPVRSVPRIAPFVEEEAVQHCDECGQY